MLVQDAEALLTLVAEGARRRRTAATRRNATSSRSHALLEIATPHATLHLADLAGRYTYNGNHLICHSRKTLFALCLTADANLINLFTKYCPPDTQIRKNNNYLNV